METLYSIVALVAFYFLLYFISTIKSRLAQKEEPASRQVNLDINQINTPPLSDH
jgi:hypothetical protein